MFFWFLIIEILNYLYILWSYQSYQDTTIELDQNCSLAEWQNFLTSRLEWIQLNHPHWIKDMLSKSFWGLPFENIALCQLRAALQMYYIRHQTPNSMAEEEVSPWVNQFIKQVAPHNPEYTQRKIKWIRINSKVTKHLPPKPLYFPLCVSSIRYLVRFTYDIYLRLIHYKNFTCSMGINYWYLNNGQPPVMIAHGVGFGSIPYLFFNRELSQTNSLLLIEVPGVSGYYPKKKIFPRPDEIVISVLEATKYFQIKKMDAIGHSYGAIVLTYLINSQKLNHIINRKIFIEPPIFIAGITKCWPETWRRYTYKDLLNYRLGAIGEWYNQQLIHNGCWLHDMTHREKSMDGTLVILAGQDTLVDAEKITIYLKERYPQVHQYIHPKAQHSDSVLIYFKKTVAVIQQFLKN